MSAGNTHTQSYLVRSVDEAMTQARRDLGPDAFLLSSRRVVGEGGQAGLYEVVFGADAVSPAADVAQALAPAVPRLPVCGPVPGVSTPVRPNDAVLETNIGTSADAAGKSARATSETPSQTNRGTTDEMAKLHAQIDEIRGLLMRSSAVRISVGRTVPELADVYARLIHSEVDHALSKDIVDRLEADMATDAFFERPASRETAANRWKSMRFDAARLENFLRAEMEHRVPVDPTLGTVAAFVGPTGAGKTTTLMKLTASDVTAGRPVRLLSLDTSRSAGPMQLQAFANTLKIPFTLVPSPDALPGLVSEAGPDEFVLIDTPGYFGSDGRGAQSAADALALCPELDVHLVVPGYMKASDLRLCVQRYGVFQPAKLLVTKLDETQAFGTVFSEAAHAGLALSFLTHGPFIPDHLRLADLDDLLALALDRRRTRAQVA